MAEWLYRNLLPAADGVTACEPRRNRWIAQDGEKDDPLDAAKLAQLHRGGYLKAVYHPESEERSILKGHVSVYHDRVRQRAGATGGGEIRQSTPEVDDPQCRGGGAS